MVIPLATPLATYGADFLFEHGAHWGVRKMLKLMNQRSLAKLKRRIGVSINEGLCFIAATDPNCYVSFAIEVTNPTPWDIDIIDVACSIKHQGVIYTHKPLVVEPLPFKIEKEVMQGKVINIRYDPFSSPLGLPTDSGNWRLDGYVLLSSYFGKFQMPIPCSSVTVGKNEQNWLQSVNYVKSKFMSMS